MKKSVLLLLLFCLVLSEVYAEDNVSSEKINALPLIPHPKAKGLDLFSTIKKKPEREENSGFNVFEEGSKGNRNIAILSGVEVLDRSEHDGNQSRRPRIGLVLSGGGARGGAHLGVIKAFEAHNIPIDAIVGTSMGSFIGGLYASGMSSGEIERMLTTMDWSKVITVDYDRRAIPYRRKHLQAAFPGNAKVGVNKDNEVVFGTGLFKRQTMLQFLKKKTLPVSHIHSFDDLRIPFRSVASRLKDGNTVVLRDGSLAESIYASIAIPGGFDPITINGDVLVDGGVADNLPLDVMRKEMNVDYIVVVDISTPYDKDAKFDSYLSVMGQLINILMRKNVEDTLKDMKGHDNEILLTPDLEGYTPLDADKYPEIIEIGRATAESAYKDDLAKFSLYEKDYYDYLNNQPSVNKYKAPIIDAIELDNGTYINDDKILSLLDVGIGDVADSKTLDKNMMDIYNLMIFDDVSYKIVNIGGQNVLKITTTPSWDVNGQVKFALGFEDNFDGHSDYFVKLEYIKFGLNSYGGEWRTRVAFGQENLLLTELYQPLNAGGHFYIRPYAYYRNKKVYVTPSILNAHAIESDLDQTFVLQARDYGAGNGLGVNITNDLRFEVLGDIRHVNPSTSALLIESNGTIAYTELESDADIYDVYAQLEYDSLDNAFFPTRGNSFKFWYKYSDQFSDEKPLTYNQYYLNYVGAFSLGRHTLLPRLRWGETFKVDDHGSHQGFTQSQDFNSFFTLGGLFNLSGLPTNAMTGNNISFVSLVYRYRLTQKDFFGSLSAPMYIGMSTESGSTWYGTDNFDTNKIASANGIYFAADTIIGPFYLGFGRAQYQDKTYNSVYFSLGQSF